MKLVSAAVLVLGFSGGLAVPPVGAQDTALTAERVLENLRTRKFSGRPVDLLVADSTLGDVFDLLGAAEGFRFELDPAVRDRVTYRIRQKPWDEILARVVSDHGLLVLSQPGGRGFKVQRGRTRILVFTDPVRAQLVLFLYHHLLHIGVAVVFLAAAVAAYLRWRRRRPPPDPAARKPLLPPEAAEDARRRVLRLLDVDKVYLREDLSLRELAEELEVTPHQLSWLINDVLGQSFSSLVNGYRVEDAKKRLADPEVDSPNMLQIGLDAGFGTKAAFNRAFKKHTGMTPSEFRRTIARQVR